MTMIRVGNTETLEASRPVTEISPPAPGPKRTEIHITDKGNGVFTLYNCSSVGVVAVSQVKNASFSHLHVNRPFMRPYPNPTTRIVRISTEASNNGDAVQI